MNKLKLRAHALEIPFSQVFRHAASRRSRTQTVWVEVVDGDGRRGYGEACPREDIPGENLPGVLAHIERSAAEWCANVRDVDGLRDWVREHRKAIDANPAAWSAVELALLDLFARREGVSVETLLGIPALEGVYTYTAVLGDVAPRAFKSMLACYSAVGFSDYRVTLSGQWADDHAKVRALRAAGIGPERVRADARHLWRSAREVVAYLDRLDYPFAALQEPVVDGDVAGLVAVARGCDCAIVLDESVARVDQLAALPCGPGWIVNVRVSKMGGLLRSIEAAHTAVVRGHAVIVGAQVGETSLLTRAALTVVQSCRAALVGQEGAFGRHLLQDDVVGDSLAFGRGGHLPVSAVPRGPGFGFESVRVPAADQR